MRRAKLKRFSQTTGIGRKFLELHSLMENVRSGQPFASTKSITAIKWINTNAIPHRKGDTDYFDCR
jgi:hypothetical protein